VVVQGNTALLRPRDALSSQYLPPINLSAIRSGTIAAPFTRETTMETHTISRVINLDDQLELAILVPRLAARSHIPKPATVTIELARVLKPLRTLRWPQVQGFNLYRLIRPGTQLTQNPRPYFHLPMPSLNDLLNARGQKRHRLHSNMSTHGHQLVMLLRYLTA
jgi:hypothetical protein